MPTVQPPSPASLPPVAVAAAVEVPGGFVTYAGNAGIKDATADLSIVASTRPCVAAGLFTRSLFAGPSVRLCRRHLRAGEPRAVLTISKNANVATGSEGERDADELAALTAAVVGCRPEDIFVACTGVIGRRLPMERVRSHFATLSLPSASDFASVARAIMTTDTVPKLASARVGEATVTGVAKGSGMIEPDMATMLAYVFTDAEVEAHALQAMFERVVAQSFNCLSIDTDTSTSDTALVLANGVAGPVRAADLEAALAAVCRSLTVQLAADGEGATKVLQVDVRGARDGGQARRVAKAVVNSPLVKCAVHGADPNWGRVVMAIGKCWQDPDITPDGVRVSFGGSQVYPGGLSEDGLAELAAKMSLPTVEIDVWLGTGEAGATVWGCDLSREYVHINSDYTT
jgi:glutamate N-acetyltransferase/amino-acid N-acetyltransferase